MDQGEYNFRDIETKWRKYWIDKKTFRTPGPGDDGFDADQPKCYVLDMFPYTSGEGLHIGHPKGYIATDIYARFKKANGYNVLHPMGFDSFGLPAEQYAVTNNVHPQVYTEENIKVITEQLQYLGMGYDWDRELATSRPEFYHWTQWIFLQLYGAWFDPDHEWTDEAGVAQVGKAWPIESLEEAFAGGRELTEVDLAAIGADSQVSWADLSETQKYRVINNYRLAYEEEAVVNWCPRLGTVLANEEVTNDGLSERGDHPVYRRPLRQWIMRITDYADRLLADLAADKLPDGNSGSFTLDWPDALKRMQTNWIGQSEGAEVDFDVLASGSDSVCGQVRVFTTRPDTLFGATFMVLAPAHPLVDPGSDQYNVPEAWPEETLDAWKGEDPARDIRTAIAEYAREAERAQLAKEREEKDKTGLFAGFYALNPVSGKKVPVFVADYVSMDYGSGAIMAVPAHDDRDYDFAKAFELDIIEVVQAPEGEETHCFTGDGTSVNSPPEGEETPYAITGLSTPDAKRQIIKALSQNGRGQSAINYKLRDWVFSRQHYWGEPFPLAHTPDGRAITTDIPVLLPEMEDFHPETSDSPDAPIRPPFGRAGDDWRLVDVDGDTYERELNSMPQWAGSCWYYLRFMDPANGGAFCGNEEQRYFGPVDLYVGGAEHAVLHLLYSRFWHKVLYDLGHVATPEPFRKLFNQGMITADAFTDDRGVYVDIRDVEVRDGEGYHRETGAALTKSPGKMGKRYKNGLPPEEVGEQYGVDALRLYEMYMGPLDASAPWSMDGIRGMQRFLQRAWRNFVTPERKPAIGGELTDDLEKLLHQTIIRVTDHLDGLRFNTAIAALIELNNAISGQEKITEELYRAFVLMLAPFAPHFCEEIWVMMGEEEGAISSQPWPTAREDLAKADTIEMPVQVNGKMRAKFSVAADADQEEVQRLALEQENVVRHLEGNEPRKIIVVPGRMVNIVV